MNIELTQHCCTHYATTNWNEITLCVAACSPEQAKRELITIVHKMEKITNKRSTELPLER